MEFQEGKAPDVLGSETPDARKDDELLTLTVESRLHTFGVDTRRELGISSAAFDKPIANARTQHQLTREKRCHSIPEVASWSHCTQSFLSPLQSPRLFLLPSREYGDSRNGYIRRRLGPSDRYKIIGAFSPYYSMRTAISKH